MKKTVDREEFCDWFVKFRPNNFSYEGRLALFEMLESYESDTEEEIEFDPLAFCCEYSEYEDIEEFWKDYDKKDYPNEEAIMDATFFWGFGESFIIQQF